MNEQYRRGAALGLSMAEVMILIVLGLLLLLVSIVLIQVDQENRHEPPDNWQTLYKSMGDEREQMQLNLDKERQRAQALEDEIDRQAGKLESLEATNSELEDENREIILRFNEEIDEHNLTKEALKSKEEKVDRIAEALASAKEELEEAKDALELESKSHRETEKMLGQTLEGSDVDQRNLTEFLQKMTVLEERNEQLEAQLFEMTANEASLEEENMNLREERERLLDEVSRLENELNEYFDEHEEYEGDTYGFDHPPCWPRPEGRPRYYYSFDVELLDNGYIVNAREIPTDYVNGEEAKLHQDIVSNPAEPRMFSPAQFRDITKGLFDWSVRQRPKCRFFAIVKDSTGKDKDVFKRRISMVREVFYVYEDK